jgi:hypothetical protein
LEEEAVFCFRIHKRIRHEFRKFGKGRNVETQKYAGMCERIASDLGSPWVGEVITFTAGVRGSLLVTTWEQNLKAIGVHKAGIERVINSTTRLALEQCHFMYQAREAALKFSRRTPEDLNTS